MGLFGGFASVIEWEEYRDDVIFWKWKQKEIKKNSRLIIKPGQAALFLNNGKLDGIFTDEGTFNIGSQIVPFLSSLKGAKYGFQSGMRSEVLFINKKEMTMQWGTKNPIMVPCPTVPGGVPIRGFGTYTLKVGMGMDDLTNMIDNVVGVKDMYTVEDVRRKVDAVLDQLLMKWISSEGKDLTMLQAQNADICRGIEEDLDYEMIKIGLTVSKFRASSFSYPQELQGRLLQAAAMGMSARTPVQPAPQRPVQPINYAPQNASAGRFCTNCGNIIVPGTKFCGNCGKPLA